MRGGRATARPAAAADERAPRRDPGAGPPARPPAREGPRRGPGPEGGRHPHPGHSGDSAAESSEEVPFGGWPRPTTRERGRGGKALVAAAVLVLLVVFVIRNSHQVRVDFIVTSGHPRLIWLIVVCTL